jgi:mRNA-degrading endonuclease RelE of RelBE toxin-antitoxin system
MRVIYAPTAAEQLEKLPSPLCKRITSPTRSISMHRNLHPFSFAKSLGGYSAYRFRIGDFRAIVEEENETLFVLLIVKRDAVYRGL